MSSLYARFTREEAELTFALSDGAQTAQFLIFTRLLTQKNTQDTESGSKILE